eukprot:SAG31_NODE_11266_length_1048_cov_1.053741_2_plen_59_part_01
MEELASGGELFDIVIQRVARAEQQQAALTAGSASGQHADENKGSESRVPVAAPVPFTEL